MLHLRETLKEVTKELKATNENFNKMRTDFEVEKKTSELCRESIETKCQSVVDDIKELKEKNNKFANCLEKIKSKLGVMDDASNNFIRFLNSPIVQRLLIAAVLLALFMYNKMSSGGGFTSNEVDVIRSILNPGPTIPTPIP